jgi:NADH-quinone oxidoreductase subunit D
MRSVIAGIGLAPGEIRIDLGEFHPSSQGGFQLHLTLDGEVITGVEPRIGFMHRGAEKLFEVRDYRQIMMLANRHDWYAPFSSELGVALTLESAMGIHPPERATWIRMLLAEFTRISALIAFLPTPQTQQVRNRIADLFEFVTGNRVHPMYARIGGVAHDIPTETDEQSHAILGEFSPVCVRVLIRASCADWQFYPMLIQFHLALADLWPGPADSTTIFDSTPIILNTKS